MVLNGRALPALVNMGLNGSSRTLSLAVLRWRSRLIKSKERLGLEGSISYKIDGPMERYKENGKEIGVAGDLDKQFRKFGVRPTKSDG